MALGARTNGNRMGAPDELRDPDRGRRFSRSDQFPMTRSRQLIGQATPRPDVTCLAASATDSDSVFERSDAFRVIYGA